MEGRIGNSYPPDITHAEYFYGFVGVGLAWQIAFLIIGTDPVRFRPLIIPSALEKFSFSAAVVLLFAYGPRPAALCIFAAIDFLFGVLFLVAFVRLGHAKRDAA